MNILFYRYGSIVEPDIMYALEELGHTYTTIELEVTDKNTSAEQTISAVSSALFAKNYQAVFSVNYYPILSAVCNIFKIRYISWTVDSPVMELYSDTLANPWNRTFLFDREQYNSFSHINPEHIFHMPLAVNTDRLNRFFAEDKKNSSRYHSAVSFVGSLYTEKCPYDKVLNLSDYTKGYLNAIMEAQSRIYGYYFIPELLTDSLIEEFRTHHPSFYIPPEKSTRDDRMTMALLYIGNKITSMERLRLMKLLGTDFPVDLYTGSDTIGLPVHNLGLAKTLTEMPHIFRNSKINLNMTAKSIRSALPLRIFDVLGCGGFLLTNYQPELTEHFTPGVDLDVFTSDEELTEKTRYYLEHKNERDEIAQNGWQNVCANHTFTIRLEQLLSLAFSV